LPWGMVIVLVSGGPGLLCLALCAGLVVADTPARHLPTPALSAAEGPVATPAGVVVEWKRPPEAISPAMADPVAGSAPEVSAGPLAQSVPLAAARPTPLLVHPVVTLPAAGPVTQGFGCSPYYTGIPGPGCTAEAFWFHDGVDIAVPIGTPVRSTLDGTVIFAGADGDGPLCNRGYRGYGLAVMVDDGQGRQALYAHLSRVDVTAGQTVEAGAVVGLSGDTGCVSGPHLHFGLRHDGELVDPLEEASH